MTLTEFVNKWNNRRADWDGFYGAQCVDLVNFYGREVLGMGQGIPFPGEGAIDIFRNFDRTHLPNYFYKLGFDLNNPPQRGDVIIWDERVGISFGHVGIVLAATASNFVSFDQNYPVGSLPHEQGHNYSGVVGWLRPKSAVELPPEQGNPQMEQELKATKRELNRASYLNYLGRGLSQKEYESRDSMGAVAIESEVAKSNEAFLFWRDVAKRLNISLTDEQIKTAQNDFWHNTPVMLVKQFDIAPYLAQISDLTKKLDEANLLTDKQKKQIEELTGGDNIVLTPSAWQQLWVALKNFLKPKI